MTERRAIAKAISKFHIWDFNHIEWAFDQLGSWDEVYEAMATAEKEGRPLVDVAYDMRVKKDYP